MKIAKTEKYYLLSIHAAWVLIGVGIFLGFLGVLMSITMPSAYIDVGKSLSELDAAVRKHFHLGIQLVFIGTILRLFVYLIQKAKREKEKGSVRKRRCKPVKHRERKSLTMKE